MRPQAAALNRRASFEDNARKSNVLYLQHFADPMFERDFISTFRHFDVSTFRCFDVSTFRHFDVSTF